MVLLKRESNEILSSVQQIARNQKWLQNPVTNTRFIIYLYILEKFKKAKIICTNSNAICNSVENTTFYIGYHLYA